MERGGSWCRHEHVSFDAWQTLGCLCVFMHQLRATCLEERLSVRARRDGPLPDQRTRTDNARTSQHSEVATTSPIVACSSPHILLSPNTSPACSSMRSSPNLTRQHKKTQQMSGTQEEGIDGVKAGGASLCGGDGQTCHNHATDSKGLLT
jgi:hypothetical protein